MSTPLYYSLVALTLVLSPGLQWLFGRGAMRLALRAESIYVDLIVDSLRPFRLVYLVPVSVAFTLARYADPYEYEVRLVSGWLLIILAVDTTVKLLTGIAGIVRHRAGKKGASSTGFIDLAKVLVVLLGLALGVSVTVETDLVTVLSGLGALTVVLMLVFRDTLLSIQASLRISSWDLLREGDLVTVPEFGADGNVTRIGLYEITVLNNDMSTSLIPTHRFFEGGNKNYRTMIEVERARLVSFEIAFDTDSVGFCSPDELERYASNPHVSAIGEISGRGADDGTAWTEFTKTGITNLDVMIEYLRGHLEQHSRIYSRHPILITSSAPSASGLPVSVAFYSRETDIASAAVLQTELLNHFAAATRFFSLRLARGLNGSPPT